MDYRDLGIVIAILVVIGSGFVIRYFMKKMKDERSTDLRDALLTVEELETHAKQIALEHDVSNNRNPFSFPIPRMNENYNFILSVYKSLNEDILHQRTVSAAAEWLLDNFYIVEEQVKNIRNEMNMDEYRRLPILRSGPMKGSTRVYAIAMELVSHSDGQIEEDMLAKYLKAYQSHSILFNREIWMIPTMLRLALIENVRNIAQKIKTTRTQWHLADDIVDEYWFGEVEQTAAMIQQLKSKIGILDEDNPSFIEHLFYRLRRSGKSYMPVLRYIDETLDKFDTTTEAIAQKEHNIQAVSTVAIGNCVKSLKYISTHNWADMFEAASYVEQILKQDPHGVYSLMDEYSRNIYRIQIERLAKIYGVSELHIAREAIALAQSALALPEEDPLKQRKCHVGYYLVATGSVTLENRQKGKIGQRTRIVRFFSARPGTIYVLSNIAITFLLTTLTGIYAITQPTSIHWMLLVLTVIAVVIPASEIAISLVNWIVVKIQKPTSFVRLELKDGIPVDQRAIVVIPAIISDIKRVSQLLETLENHYISNSEPNLYFALIGAFKDYGEADAQDDLKILQATFDGILALNRKYAKNGEEIFYFYHRIRKYNESDGNWTGWERKRGALMEFNEILLGNIDTSFAFYSNFVLPADNIKYVITLDADTLLPMGMAKKMIGTMAHPLNVPIIDEQTGVVTQGYGLMQPRVSFDVDSSNRSVFSKIYTGQEGIDPYASAISDVYQDLFDEGIFTGKGIYDLKVFQKVLKDTIPNNAVLSHDLLEGSYVRAALVNDLELIDAYPSKYNAFIARMYRWIRGDWQLLPWLGKQPYNANNLRTKNVLSTLSIWKIIDNLRRSLVSPAIMFLLFLGFSILPGKSLFWAGFALLTLAIPFLMALIDRTFAWKITLEPLRRHIAGFFGLNASIGQLFLRLTFIAYQSNVALNAIFVTLKRVLITKKNMLEWVTSADAEKTQDNSLKGYLSQMGTSTLSGILLVLLAYYFKRTDLALSLAIMLLWMIAPFLAYAISKDKKEIKLKITLDEISDLRITARKTWRYFEEFANAKNNYLVPDNYQEEPPRGIAYRTSPTDIALGLMATLAARDFGFISTVQMCESLEKTIATLERMEKWNGHLYNWYDTRTLKPMNPAYVSTVDNGNYVCYLITLVEGIKVYLNRPLNDPTYIQGLRDTIMCGFQDATNHPTVFDIFDTIIVDGNLDQIQWRKTLDALGEGHIVPADQKQLWRYKLNLMVRQFILEADKYIPWAGLIETLPEGLIDEASSENFDHLRKLLSIPTPLKDSDAFFKAVFDLIGQLNQSVSPQNPLLLHWLDDMKLAMIASNEANKAFVRFSEDLIRRIETLAWDTKFKQLYDERKQLFSIGYNVQEQKLTNSYYDLFASESRQTSFIAIARGEIPPKHWNMLGRPLTVVNRYKGLVSWSGTMFEYLMPLLIMKNYRNTLLDETYSFIIKNQINYGKQRGMPWGTSESGFNSLDVHLDYQYKAIGVPWLGLKRGLIEDAVCAPYASFLALMVAPRAAMKNIELLKSQGMEGAYGFFEAADYTPGRLGFESKRVIIKSYMAHHQGMSLMAIGNILNDNVMQRRFQRNPYVKAAQLLLQEKVPTHVVFTKETKEKIIPLKENIFQEPPSVRIFDQPDLTLPKVHILSNGYYSVMISDKGTGYSKDKMVEITRYREDATLDHHGMFFYIKNMSTGEIWSSTYAPLDVLPKPYEVTFTPDKAAFKRRDGQIETLSEIVVTSGDHAEIRRIRLKNLSDSPVEIELTSYYEVVIADQKVDLAHPAFSNLFVETEYDAANRALIANRRPRSDKENRLWIANTMVTDSPLIDPLQVETDRMAFIGRDRNLKNPQAMLRGRPLSNTVGPVLDPVFSMRAKVAIGAGKTVQVYFVTTLSQSKETLTTLIEKYASTEICETAFRLALTRSQMENRYLNIKPDAMRLYQEMLSNVLFINPLRRRYENAIRQNRKGQSDLWPFAISGDKPIVLVTLNKAEEMPILYEVLKAHEYWRLKDLMVDLVILSNEEQNYFNPLTTLITDIVQSRRTHDVLNRRKDVFILNAKTINESDLTMFYAIARLVFTGNGQTMEEQIADLPEKPLIRIEKSHQPVDPDRTDNDSVQITLPELRFFNGLGGFNLAGDEYVIHLQKDQTTPAPWTNVIANPHFGFIATEAGGGYTWCTNSRENKLTPFSNDAVCDPSGEVFYLNDETSKSWTVTPLPIREDAPYVITHGFGYTRYEHRSHGIEAKLLQFVPLDEAVKLSRMTLTNHESFARRISCTYYIQPVLGVDAAQTAMHIVTQRDAQGPLTIENHYNTDFSGKIAFLDTSERISSVTGDRKEFFGSSSLDNPECLHYQSLSNHVGAGYEPCAAMQVEIELEANETKEFTFMLGMSDSMEEVTRLSDKFKTNDQTSLALNQVKDFWERTLRTVHVKTPDDATNLMLNGWLLYQTIACRLWARSSFYQSGGAFGFRDQLQDALAIASTLPMIAREQILRHAAHQFTEGDVMHWWHEPQGKGTRTRISDDLLWLPYVTAEYVRITGDMDILQADIPFLSADVLNDSEDERYSQPGISTESATLLEHCERAIEHASRFGTHGLPLIGTGDWNDGMNTVGNKGKGESIWLGWFMSDTLRKFAQLCNDATKSKKYLKLSAKITAAIDEHGWDGDWYKRAFFDDGSALGSSKNKECKIDSLAQSWAVIAGQGDAKRAKIAINSMEHHLVVRDQGLIKLLTPPFNEGEADPGYIKGYLPGVRENGGQYTHAAVWVIGAFASMGEGDKAWELFDLINPINHTRNLREYSIYKVEPYVVAADVYSEYPHIGRGGWSWYTGSAGWMYRCGIENILGLIIEGNTLTIRPNAPRHWKKYTMTYRYLDTLYQINVLNPDGLGRGSIRLMIDGNLVENKAIDLINDAMTHRIDALILAGK